MHLRAIKLRGFKSFPEPVEVRLEPGVAVVVGPNGSGKSNVADAIVWAAGSMAPSELRAEKPDDVIFAGGSGRPAEAAGLGRFKRRKHRAELKLARVAIQVERARDVEAEVKKRLRPLALQATAAERAEKLRGEIASLRARVAELDLAELRERLQDGEGRRTAAVLARKHADEKLDTLLEERRRAEEELADAAGRREQATATLYRLRSARERLELRRESAQSLLDGFRSGLARPRRVLDARVRAERESLREQARVARERLQTLERALAEREGLPPAARALAEEGERLALSLLDVEPGNERAVAAALAHRAAAIVADDAPAALALAERARDAGLGNLTVLVGRDPSELVAELPVVSADDLLASPVPAVTADGFGWDPVRRELWFAGETAEAVWLELEARRRALAGELDELEARAQAPIPPEAYTFAPDATAMAIAGLAARLVSALDVAA